MSYYLHMKKLIYILVAVFVVYLGWEFFRPRPMMQSQTGAAGAVGTASIIDSVTGDAGNNAVDSAQPAVIGPASVIYSLAGFSPANVTVKKGETVMWTNVSSEKMWVAINEHPGHAGYDGTDRKTHCTVGVAASFDQCAASDAGSQWSFVFNNAGVWKYHNHINEVFGGTITVIE